MEMCYLYPEVFMIWTFHTALLCQRPVKTDIQNVLPISGKFYRHCKCYDCLPRPCSTTDMHIPILLYLP